MINKKHSMTGWLVWIWFLLLAVIFTRPLITRMGNEIAGEIGDNIYFIWMIGWVKKALFKLGVDPMNVWFLNYPEGWNMAHTEITPAQLAWGEIFTFFGSETFAYNAAMLLSFVLSGVITFYWVRHLTGSTAAGLLSGTIYACLPYRQAHYLAGHLNLSGTQWLPLFFWGWFDLLKSEGTNSKSCDIRIKPALLAAVGLGLTALTSQYYFFMLVIVAGFQMVWMILIHQREKRKIHPIGNDGQIPIQLGSRPFRLDDGGMPDMVHAKTDELEFAAFRRETAQDGHDLLRLLAHGGQSRQIAAGGVMRVNHVGLLLQDQPPKLSEITQVASPTAADDGICKHVQSFLLQGVELGLHKRIELTVRLVPAGYEKDFHRMLFQYHSQAAAKPARASNLG